MPESSPRPVLRPEGFAVKPTRDSSPRPRLRPSDPETIGVMSPETYEAINQNTSDQTERAFSPRIVNSLDEVNQQESTPFSGVISKTVDPFSEEKLNELEDYLANTPKPQRDPIDEALSRGWLKAIKSSRLGEKYKSNLNLLNKDGIETVRGMFKSSLGAMPKNEDGTPWDPRKENWCATFVNTILMGLGADLLQTGDKYDRLRARKYVKYGSPVERNNIQQGDIVVLDFPRNSDGDIDFRDPNAKRDGVGDHVTFYAGDNSSANRPDSGFIGVLGGNQGLYQEIGLTEYRDANVLAIRRITYDDIDYKFTKELAEENPDFNSFLKDQGEGFDFESFSNPDPMSGFDEGGLAENDNLDLARSYGVTVVDPKETDQTLKAFGKAAIESIPGISTAATVRDIKEELEEEDPSWGKIGLLAAGEVVGMVPGLGDAAQNMVRQGVKRFKTGRGSTYKVEEGSRTTRERAPDEVGGEVVTQPTSGKTIYMSYDDMERFGLLFQKGEPGLYQFVPIEGQKGKAHLTFAKDYGPNKAGDPVPNTEVSFTTEPKVGDHPVEIYESTNNNRVSIHFGSEITEVMDDVRPANYAEDLAQAEKLIESDELLKEWRKENGGKGQRFENPAKQDAEDFYQGDITRKELQTLINSKLGDPTLFTLDNFPDMPTITDTVGGMGTKARKYGILGVKGFDLKEGQRVGSRLDIPAYNEYDKWIVSIHDGNVDKGGVIGYGQAIRLKNIEFKSDPKMALDIARKKELKAADPEKGTPAKYQTKATIARIHGDYVKEDPYELYEQAKLLLDDPEWTQVGMNPYRGSFFYDKKTGMPVLNAEEVIQVGPLVLAKKVQTPKLSELKKYFGGEFKDGKYKSAARTKDGKVKVFNQGGPVMQEQMEMAFMQEGGIKDDGMKRDPVSGNEIPPGSMASEVRDDIPAMLSEGEYVVPADVLRFYGVNFFENLRNKAKSGLQNMENNGRIGGEPLSPNQVQQNMSGKPQAGAPARMPVAANTGPYMAGQTQGLQQSQGMSQNFNPMNYSVVGSSTLAGGQMYQPTQGSTNQRTFVHSETGETRVVSFNDTGGTIPPSDIQYTRPPWYAFGSAALKKAQEAFKNPAPTNDDRGDPPTPPEPKDPNEWAKDITDPMTWANENLQGKATGILSTIQLGTSVARVNAMAIVAEAKGNTELADNLRDKAREFVAANPVLNSLPNAWIDGDRIAADLQEDENLKDTLNNIFGMKTEEQKKFGIRQEQRKAEQRAKAAAQAKADKEAAAKALESAQKSGDDDDPFFVSNVSIDRDPMGQATMSTTYGSGSNAVTASATADEIDPNDPLGYTADVNKGGLMTKKRAKKK